VQRDNSIPVAVPADSHPIGGAWAAVLGYYERNPPEVERYASDLLELATRQRFRYWRACGVILRGWACSTLGDTAEGISWIEHGIQDNRSTGTMISLPLFLVLKAEALHLASGSYLGSS